MKIASGYLRRLGESTVDMNAETKTYSLIEVGDQIIPNVTVSRKLANFVSDGVGVEVTLHLHGSVIVACEVNGKTYYDSQYASVSGKLGVMACGVVAGFLLMIGFSLLFGLVFGMSGGGFAIVALLMFPVGAVLGGKWVAKKFKPREFGQWKAQGATAV